MQDTENAIGFSRFRPNWPFGRLSSYHKQAFALVPADHFDKYPCQEANPYVASKRKTQSDAASPLLMPDCVKPSTMKAGDLWIPFWRAYLQCHLMCGLMSKGVRWRSCAMVVSANDKEEGASASLPGLANYVLVMARRQRFRVTFVGREWNV